MASTHGEGMNQREQARQRTRAAILSAAREEVARNGGGGLSMRAIARTVGVVSSAVYRYFPTREALLTTMIVESYQDLGATLAQALQPPSARRPNAAAPADPTGPDPQASAADQWRTLANTFRTWALEHPHEFQLLYGTPIPGYQAPPETIPAAALVAQPFLQVGAVTTVATFEDVAPLGGLVGTGEPSGLVAVVAELAALVGTVTLELNNHFVGVADPGQLYAAVVERQISTLGLT